MTVIIKTEDQTWVVDGAEELTIETKHNLVGTQIPTEEGRQGFRWTEDK